MNPPSPRPRDVAVVEVDVRRVCAPVPELLDEIFALLLRSNGDEKMLQFHRPIVLLRQSYEVENYTILLHITFKVQAHHARRVTQRIALMGNAAKSKASAPTG